MQRKNFELLFAFMAVFLLLIVVHPKEDMGAVDVTSSTSTVYVDPQISYGIIGQNLLVNICVSDVADLYGWELKLGWNTTILDAVDVSEGALLASGGDPLFAYKINNTLGYMIVDCTLLGSVSGVNGSGVLTSVKFYVETFGECPLDLYDTILINSAEQAIEHVSLDGYYYTSVDDVAVIDLTASSMQINVTVENQGTRTETFNVSAYYTRLFDPLIGTQTVTLTKGAVTTLTFIWNPPFPGQYEIRADASTVPGETEVTDNVRTMIIQIGHSASNQRNQAANSLNGLYIVIGVFIFTLAISAKASLQHQEDTKLYSSAHF
jgi:hypothetical protein